MGTTSRTFSLIIKDECLSAWMAINNTFTATRSKQWPRAKRYWDGVFFQLGKYKRRADGKFMDILDAVTLYEGSTTIEAFSGADLRDNTIWINIVADRKRSLLADPMVKSHLRRLVRTGRTLHNYFKPYRSCITFWQDRENGYRLVAEQKAAGGLHNKYTFTCPITDDFRVEVMVNGRGPQILKQVTKIVVSVKGGGDHGDFMNPPQRP
jgi:hypothetical protein